MKIKRQNHKDTKEQRKAGQCAQRGRKAKASRGHQREVPEKKSRHNRNCLPSPCVIWTVKEYATAFSASPHKAQKRRQEGRVFHLSTTRRGTSAGILVMPLRPSGAQGRVGEKTMRKERKTAVPPKRSSLTERIREKKFSYLLNQKVKNIKGSK